MSFGAEIGCCAGSQSVDWWEGGERILGFGISELLLSVDVTSDVGRGWIIALGRELSSGGCEVGLDSISWFSLSVSPEDCDSEELSSEESGRSLSSSVPS